MKHLLKSISHVIEFIVFFTIYVIFAIMPLDMASWLGGLIARKIGPKLRAHNIAIANMTNALPELSDAQRQTHLINMWDNLGRTVGELAHHYNMTLNKRVTMENAHHLHDPNEQTLFFSAHLANWELTYPIGKRHGIDLWLIYRRINNPYVERFIAYLRKKHCYDLVAKGPHNAFKLIRAIRKKYSVAMLIDQKMNDGIAVPFFGKDAMTAPAIAELALKYNLPIKPVQIVRTKGAHFRGILHPAIEYTPTGHKEADVLAIMTLINATLESWIRDHPEQWFWVHRRWPKK